MGILYSDSQPIVGSTNPYGNNQGYNQYPPQQYQQQQGFSQPAYVNQGYNNPVPYQPGPPQNPPYQPQAYPPTYSHQGFQPIVPGQFPPPPPPPPGQAFINLPSCITPVHRNFHIIQLNIDSFWSKRTFLALLALLEGLIKFQ